MKKKIILGAKIHKLHFCDFPKITKKYFLKKQLESPNVYRLWTPKLEMKVKTKYCWPRKIEECEVFPPSPHITRDPKRHVCVE